MNSTSTPSVFLSNSSIDQNFKISGGTIKSASPFLKSLAIVLLAALFFIAPGKSWGQSPQTFTTSGTWTCPAGVFSVQVECWGGGGAGGSARGQTSFRAAAGGGAGGAYAKANSISVTPATVYTVTVGAGGAFTITNGASSPGGDSWFSTSSTVIAKGGAGSNSLATSGADLISAGGIGTTTASIGDIIYKGGNGATGSNPSGAGFSGGGGSSAGTGSDGNSATNATAAAAVTGGGIGGTGRTSNGGSGSAPASGVGGGGGGAWAAASTTQRNGGNGRVGQVILTWSATTAPLAPTMGTITPGNQQLSVAFTAGGDGGSAITSYKYSTDGGATFLTRQAGTTAPPIVITTLSSDGTTALTNGTSYNIQIKAVNGVGDGTATATTAATPYTTPSAPTINSITPGNTQLTVAFTAGSDGGSAITDYEYSINGGSTFTSAATTTSPIVITGLTNGTPYDVQLKALNIAGAGAATSTTQGTPVAPVTPTITANGTLSALSTTYGTASSTTSFTLSGATLTSGITVTPPVGFEVSTASDFSSSVGNNGSPLVVGSAPTVSTTTIFVRLLPTASVAGSPYSGNIVLTSAGATNVNVATASGTVDPAPLTITGISAASTTYNGTTTPSVTISSLAFAGLQNGDAATVTGSPTYAYATPDAGAAKAITQTGSYSASFTVGVIGNYTITQPTLTADINPLAITLTASAQSKNFNTTSATTLATSFTITSGALVGSDNISTVTLSYSGSPAGNLATATAGAYTITPSAPVFSIGSIGNYNISFATGTLTIDAIAASAPTSIVITPDDAQLSVAFTAASDGGSAITNYKYSTDGGSSFTPVSPSQTTSPIVITGLTNGVTYQVQIRAVTGFGDGTATANTSGTPALAPVVIYSHDMDPGATASPYTQAPDILNVNLSTPTQWVSSTGAFTNFGGATGQSLVIQPGNGVTSSMTLTFNVASNFQASITSFNFWRQRTTNGPANITSIVINGTTVATNLSNPTSGASVGNTNVSAPATNLTGTVTVVLNLSAPTGSSQNFRLDNFTLTGNVTPSSNTWIGTTGNFNDAANWSLGAPTTTQTLVINTGNVTMTANFDVQGSLTLNGGTLTVNPDVTLSVTGGTLATGTNSLTFKSAINGSGSLGQVTAGGTVTGNNVTVERYIPNNGFRSWRLLSVPTSGSQTIRNSWQDGGSSTVISSGYGTQITGPVAGGGLDAVSPVASMLSWNGTGFVGIANTNASIAGNKSYFIYIRGERTQGITGGISSSSATTLRTNGTVYTGEQTFTLPATDQFGLIANLYPSAIDLDSIVATGFTPIFYYIWDSKIQSGNSLGMYKTIDASAGFSVTPGGGSYGTNNRIIESGQSFFVQTNNAVGTVTINENAKIAGSANGSLGLRPSTPVAAIAKLRSTLISLKGSSSVADENVVKFDNAYPNTVDEYDALKFSNAGENFGILRDNKTLVIEGRQPASIADTIYYRMWNMQPHAYQFQFEPTNLGGSGLTAVLEDKYLQKSTIVDLNITNSVNFTVDANAGSSASDRFKVVFKQLAPLPVSILSISANRTAAGVTVNWKVAGERGIRSYEIVRSIDGRSFTAAGTIAATGNSVAGLSYSLLDATAPTATIFYKVKSIGVNGEIKFSSIVKVAGGKVKAAISISPNPVEGAVVNLQLKNQPEGKYSVRILTNIGQVILSNKLQHAGGNSTQLLTLPTGIAKGTYQLEVTLPDNSRQVQTLFINSNK